MKNKNSHDYTAPINLLILILVLGSAFIYSQQKKLWQRSGANLFYTGKAAIGIQSISAGSNFNVAGKIRTTEVNITPLGWSDFVFDDEYNLMPLEKLNLFISENKHLPGIPSGSEMANAINVGEMQSKLLQKIEELTLYIIEADKKIDEQAEVLKNLSAETSRLGTKNK